MSILTTKIIRKIAEISPEEWNSAFPSIAESYFFLKTIDESEFEGVSFYYILVYDGSILVGAAPCFIFNYSLDTTVEGPLKKPFSWLSQVIPWLLKPKTLICGILAAEGRIGLAGERKELVVREISSALENLAKKTRAAIIAFKDFSLDYTGQLDVLLRNGYGKMESFPSVDLKIDFKTFEDYLAGLSYSTRKELRRKFKRVDSAVKIDFKVVASVADIIEDIYSLYIQTFSKSEVQFEKLNKEFFINISKNMGDQTRYFLWYINGKLIAFNLCLVSGDTLVDEYIGLDYRIAYQYHLYFVTFRDVIKWCLNNGIKMYQSGALTYDPKKRFGCRFIPLYIYAKHTSPILNPFLKILCKFLKPENFDETLRSMKKRSFIKKNNLTVSVFLMMAATNIIESFAELCMKIAVNHTGMTSITLANAGEFLVKSAFVPFLWVGVALYFLNFFIWMVILSRLDLSVALPIGGMCYIIVALLSKVFLHETLGIARWIGIILIVFGVYCISRSSQGEKNE